MDSNHRHWPYEDPALTPVLRCLYVYKMKCLALNMKTLKEMFLKIFGDIKVFRFPLWIVYDPDMYGMTGTKIRHALDTIRRGDIVLRGYRHYADGYFIPGKFSHSGIYVGNNQVVHAVSEGVSKIDILDFLMCDICCILRAKNKAITDSVVGKAESYIGTAYDFDFSKGDKSLYCHELTAISFAPYIKVERFIPKILGGIIRGKHKVFLAQSFLESPDFEIVYDSTSDS